MIFKVTTEKPRFKRILLEFDTFKQCEDYCIEHFEEFRI